MTRTSQLDILASPSGKALHFTFRMPGRRNRNRTVESYELPSSPPAAAVEEPLLNSDNSFNSNPDRSGDASLQPLSPPRWSRRSSRRSREGRTVDPLFVEASFSPSTSAYPADRAASPGMPVPTREGPFTPPHARPGPRPISAASTNMSVPRSKSALSDYDSVYQLWRRSDTPSSFMEFADGDSRRASSAMDLEKIEAYRAGGVNPMSPGLAQKEYQSLHKGQAGRKGRKDYRAVGLAKYGPPKDKRMSASRKCLIITAVGLVIAILAVAIVVPVYMFFLRDKGRPSQANSDTAGGSGQGSTPSEPNGSTPERQVAIWGTNGSVIDLGNGNSFTYINNFGGRWASQPLNNTAQAQNYTPPLDREFDFARNRMLGVNLGGWLVTEPFIVPALYEPYENTSSPVVDEFTLSQRYRSEGGVENLRQKLTEHYETFITEQDFASIAAAGLNWVRLPFGFWAIETYANEPFLEGVSWNYVLKAIQWARKYGLRINLDLHAAPGSQNAYNHSGRLNFLNFLMGRMGRANGDRTMDYIQRVTQFISQPEIRNVVPMFSVINEPNAISIGQPALESWYSQLYTMLRRITGTGAGNGPYITIHDGFLPLNSWQGFLSGSDRVAWDTHPYLCFGEQNNDPWDVQILKPCRQFTPLTDSARSNMGVTMGGEISLAINDCGLFLNGVNQGTRYDGSYRGNVAGEFPRMGSCQSFDDWENYTDDMKQGLRRFALTSMDSLQDFFFWTWKIGNSLRTGKPTSPMWSYSLGLQQGWMPTNPLSESSGACAAQASRLQTTVPSASWGGSFEAWQTGRAGSYSPSLDPWPPQSLVSANAPVSQLPSYTATKSITPLPAPTLSVTATVSGQPTAAPTIGSWFNTAINSPFYTQIAGCNYPPDQYNLTGWDSSGWPCSGGQRRREALLHAQPTMLPQ